jgi:hypothetical protein
MWIDKNIIVMLCGIANLWYIAHLLSVCLPETLNGDGIAYNGGVSVIGSCIVGQIIALVCIVLIIVIAAWNYVLERLRRY